MRNTITTILNANVSTANRLNPILMFHNCEKYVQNARSLTFESNEEDAILILRRLSALTGTQITALHEINEGNRSISLLISCAMGQVIPDKIEIKYLVRWHRKKLEAEEKSAVLKDILPRLASCDKAKASAKMDSVELNIIDKYWESSMFPNVISIKRGSRIDVFVN